MVALLVGFFCKQASTKCKASLLYVVEYGYVRGVFKHFRMNFGRVGSDLEKCLKSLQPNGFV